MKLSDDQVRSVKIKQYRLSTEDVVKRLAAKGFTLVGEYAGRLRSHCSVRCANGHVWNALIGNLVKENNTGCPHCIGKVQLTMDEVHRRLAVKKIKTFANSPRVARRAKFECENGHVWEARLSTVMRESACPYCKINRPLTVDDVNARISDRGYTVVGGYVSAAQHAQFECSHGHTWSALPDNILRGKGCPSCAEHGFNPKYSSFFYTIHILSKDTEYIGFGITKDIETRYANHAREIKNSGFNQVMSNLYLFDSGHDARALENAIKERFKVVDTGIRGFRKEAIAADDYHSLVEMLASLEVPHEVI